MVEILLVTLFLVTFIIFVFSFAYVCLKALFTFFCRAVNLYKKYAAEINTYKYLQI